MQFELLKKYFINIYQKLDFINELLSNTMNDDYCRKFDLNILRRHILTSLINYLE